MSRLTFKQAKYIRFLIEAKNWGDTVSFRDVSLADIANLRDENKQSVYLDTRSSSALSFEDASQFIEDARKLPFAKSKEEFSADRNVKIAEYKAAQQVQAAVVAEVAEVVKVVKASAKKAPAKAKNPKRPTAAEGFVNGKFTVGDRSKIAPVARDIAPVNGTIYAVVGADFKVTAKADSRGRIRLSVA